MRPTPLLALVLPALLLCSAAPTAADAQERGATASIYGIEFDRRDGSERVLIFADREAPHYVTGAGSKRVVIEIENARLDPTADSRVEPTHPSVVKAVRSYEARRGSSTSVRVELNLSESQRPKVTARGSLISVSFPVKVAPSSAETLQLRVKNMELRELVRIYASAAKEPFLYDDTLQGRVTLHTPQTVTLDEARELLNVALMMKGFAIVPAPGGQQRIVPVVETGALAPWRLEELDPEGEGLVATMVPLRAADAMEVSSVLMQLIGPSFAVVPYAATNSLILAGTENRILRMLEIVNGLDESARVELVIYHLRYRSSDFVAQILAEAWEPQLGEQALLEFWPDARTNSIILRAAPERLDEVRAFMRDLDRPVETGGGIRIYRARHADPERLAALLMGLARGESVVFDEDEESDEGPDPLHEQSSPIEDEPPTGAQLVSHDDTSNILEGQDFAVVVDPPSRSLVIRADEHTQELIADLLEELDVVPRRVSVDITIFELNSNDSLDLGFEAIVPIRVDDNFVIQVKSDPDGGGAKFEGVLARADIGSTTIPVTSGGVTTEVQLPDAVLTVEAAATTLSTRLLMKPHLLMVSGEEQTLTSGDEIPVPVSTTDGNTLESLQTRQNIERYNTGITVRMTPVVGQEGVIHMDVYLELSALAGVEAGSGSFAGASNQGPIIQKREIEATVDLRPNTMAILALYQNPKEEKSSSGLPYLKDIPWLGQFFRIDSNSTRYQSLVVTLQARVLESFSDDLAETLRRRLGFERAASRTEDLLPASDAPYAIRVETRTDPRSADAVARFLREDGWAIEVTSWESMGRTYFDVYVTGVDTLAQATALADELSAAGWLAEVVVLKGLPRDGEEHGLFGPGDEDAHSGDEEPAEGAGGTTLEAQPALE